MSETKNGLEGGEPIIIVQTHNSETCFLRRLIIIAQRE